MIPKVFISYSWSSPGHQARVRQWAERLASDGVDVVIDIWNLREGDDVFAFMERMVNDQSITHVLLFSDSEYASKADSRTSGVGTESQIISREIYDKVQQSVFIPIVCEFSNANEPYLPVFVKSRIWIDFSTPEAENANWERLIRLLFGKPAHQKPSLGKAPTYITEDVSAPASSAGAKLMSLRAAIMQSHPRLHVYRDDFLNACCEHIDALRIRSDPGLKEFGHRVLEDCARLKIARDQIVEWVLLESRAGHSDHFTDALISLLERLLELKSRPPELIGWNERWFDAHRVFTYETFLYIVAALLRVGAFDVLQRVFSHHYLLPETERSGLGDFDTFDTFYGYSDLLQILAPEGQTLYSPTAALLKRHADRADIPFTAIMEAELLVLLMTFISDSGKWYPQTFHYAPRNAHFPFFLRAARSRDFQRLARITGIDCADELREVVKRGQKRLAVETWRNFWTIDRSFWTFLNMDRLDTLP